MSTALLLDFELQDMRLKCLGIYEKTKQNKTMNALHYDSDGILLMSFK